MPRTDHHGRGTVERAQVWWQGLRGHTESSSGPRYVAVHGDPDAESGFARYRPVDTENWFVSDQRTIVVEDFFAPTIDAYVGLLRFLLGLDLIDRVVFWMLPVDDPLPWLLVDRRAAKVTRAYDETWLRIVDARRVLSARRYAGDGSVTIAVNDPLVRSNSDQLCRDERGRGADGAAPAAAHRRERARRGSARRHNLAQSRRGRACPSRRHGCAGRGGSAVRGAPCAICGILLLGDVGIATHRPL